MAKPVILVDANSAFLHALTGAMYKHSRPEDAVTSAREAVMHCQQQGILGVEVEPPPLTEEEMAELRVIAGKGKGKADAIVKAGEVLRGLGADLDVIRGVLEALRPFLGLPVQEEPVVQI